MAFNNNNQHTAEQAPFWDFVRSFGPAAGASAGASAGVDHTPHQEQWGPPMGAFPFGFGPEGRRGRGGWGRGGWGGWGRGGFGGWGGPDAHPHHGPGRHGRHGGRGRKGACRHERSFSHERESEETGESHDESHGSRSPSRDTLRERSHSPPPHFGPRDGSQGPPPPPHDGEGPRHGHHHGPGPKRHGPGHHGRRGPGRGPHADGHGPHAFGHGPRHGHRHGRGPRGPPPPPYGAPFDMSALLGAFASHPFADALRSFATPPTTAPGEADNGVTEVEDDVQKFTPPIDVFSTPSAYILHIALPGAKKEDVGVNWDADKKVLNVAGVVYRSGDEEFLKTLTVGERKIGMFEREVSLGDQGEVDGDEIKAKLEDGVLVVTVGKIEKEWTEVKRVDIE